LSCGEAGAAQGLTPEPNPLGGPGNRDGRPALDQRILIENLRQMHYFSHTTGVGGVDNG